jgi:hypothetical protein
MNEATGFLVVLKRPDQVLHSYNPKYRGLYRTRPFYVEEYEKGFNDPYFSGKFTDGHGLVPNLQLAIQVLDELSKVETPTAFEILHVKEWTASSTLVEEAVSELFLGFDIACDSPFWSIVVDSPNPNDPEFRGFLTRLNQYGLFGSAEEARAYLEKYLASYPDKRELVLRMWQVHLVESEVSGS